MSSYTLLKIVNLETVHKRDIIYWNYGDTCNNPITVTNYGDTCNNL